MTSDELAGRDVVEDKVNDFLNTYMPNHASREPSPQQDTEARSIPDSTPKTVARDDNTKDAIIEALLNSHGSSRDELAGRDDPQARGIPDGSTKTDHGSATDAFIHALMSSRDTSKEITADDMLTLASLASRALDELD